MAVGVLVQSATRLGGNLPVDKVHLESAGAAHVICAITSVSRSACSDACCIFFDFVVCYYHNDGSDCCTK